MFLINNPYSCKFNEGIIVTDPITGSDMPRQIQCNADDFNTCKCDTCGWNPAVERERKDFINRRRAEMACAS